MDTEEEKAALDFANGIREQLSLQPVDKLYKGYPCNPRSCPITNTIYDDDLDREKYSVYTQWGVTVVREFDHTPSVREYWTSEVEAFVQNFDEYKYPDLIEDTAETLERIRKDNDGGEKQG